ncbi:MAG: hypothetical protein ABIE68_01975 [bacterium]
MIIPGWDFVIGLVFVLAVGFGLMMRKNQIRIFIISIYIAFAVTNEIGNQFIDTVNKVGEATKGEEYQQPSGSLLLVILFAAVVIGLTLWGGFSIKGSGKALTSGMMTILYGVVGAGLMISSLIAFLPPEWQADLLASSDLAQKINNFKTWWIVLPVLLIFVDYFLNKRKSLDLEG